MTTAECILCGVCVGALTIIILAILGTIENVLTKKNEDKEKEGK